MIQALRDLDPAEEILYDYGETDPKTMNLVTRMRHALYRSNKSVIKQGVLYIAHIVCMRSHRINAIVKAILRLVGWWGDLLGIGAKLLPGGNCALCFHSLAAFFALVRHRGGWRVPCAVRG